MGTAILVIVAVLYPISPHEVSSTLPLNLGDPSLNTWILSWQVHALGHEPTNWFDGNIFASHGMALGYSEVMLPLVPVFGTLWFVTGSVVAAHNLLLVGLLVFAMCTTYHLARWFGTGTVAALAAATAYTFSGYTYAHLGHLQLLTFGFFPLATLWLLRMLQDRRLRDGMWFGLSSAGLVTACLYYAVIWVLAAGAVIIADLLRQRLRPARDWWRAVGIGLAVTAIAISPLLITYARFQSRVHFRRGILPGTGLALSDIAAPPSGSRRYGLPAATAQLRDAAAEHTFFTGLVVVAFASFLLVLAVCRVGKSVAQQAARPWASISPRWYQLSLTGIVALFVAAGPDLPLIGATLRGLYEATPGLGSIRLPARLAQPALLVVAIAAGRALDLAACAVARHVPERSGLGHAVALAGLLLVVTDLPATVTRADATPAPTTREVYDALADQPPGMVAELPAASGDAGALGVYTEAPRMLWSIGDWRPRFNGTSGGDPPGFAEDVARANAFPSVDAVAFLRGIGVRYVVLHFGTETDRLNVPAELARAAAEQLPAAVVARFPDAVLFDLDRLAVGASSSPYP